MSDTESLSPQNTGAPSKGLLRLVYIMGVVLVLLFLTLIGGLVWKASNRKTAAPPSVEVDLLLNGAAVKSAELDNGQMLVTTDTELIVVDVAKKAVVLRAKMK